MKPIARARHRGIEPALLLAPVCLLLVCLSSAPAPAVPGRTRSKPRTIKDLERGSRLPGTVRFPNWTLAKIFKLLEASTGNRLRCVKDTYSGEEDPDQLEKKVSVGVRKADFWKVVDAVAKAAELEVLGVNDRRLDLISKGQLGAATDIESAGAPVTTGAFLLRPESIQENLFVRVRPEPWIGLPYLKSYRLTVERGDGTTAEQAAREFAPELISTTAEELYLPVSAEVLKGSRRVAKVDLEADLVVAAIWETKTLGTLEEILGKPQELGGVVVTVAGAEVGAGPVMGSKAVYLELGVEKFFLPRSSISVLDKSQKTIEAASFAQSADGKILMRFDVDTVGEIESYRLKVEVPAKTIDYKLQASLENLVIGE